MASRIGIVWFMFVVIKHCLGDEFRARLVNGSSDAGRVEIFFNREWRPMCDEGFGQKDALVVCRMLGFNSAAAVPVSSARYGAGTGICLFYHLDCVGTEISLARCPMFINIAGFSRRQQYVGVKCNTEVSASDEYRLAGTLRSSQHMGRVEVRIMGRWTAVCGNKFSRSDAKVICRQFGYPTNAAMPMSRSSFGPRQEKGALLADYTCKGTESTILDCPKEVYGYSEHCNTEEFSVVCSNYNPIVRVTSDVDSCQPQTTGVNLCVVTQNENVTLVCEADSNPPPVSTTWSGKINSTGQHLHIISADPTTHDGLYTCAVNNTPADGDGRLNFVSSYRFSVIVQSIKEPLFPDPPTELTFRVNGVDNRTVTVAENTEDVDLVCRVKGRPRPRIRVVNNTDDQLLGAVRQGDDIRSTKTTGEVFFPVRKIQCEACGDYTCTADNGVGRASQTITLLILCAPKRGNVGSQLPVLTFGESKPQLNVEMTAYPVPFVKSKSYQRFHKHDSEGSARVEDRIHAVCITRSSASVTCTISVVNVTEADEGVYQIVFTNGLGDLPFNFTVRRYGLRIIINQTGRQQCL